MTTPPAGARRAPRSDGARTRAAILSEAARLASVEGLEGLTIGNLAGALSLSKSGLYAHFGSKLDLQLATIDEAERVFDAEVVSPAAATAPGLPQLHALCRNYLAHLRRRTFPGGCFFAAAALEMGSRPGPVRDRIAAFQRRLTGLIGSFVLAAQQRGELAEEDPRALAFEVNALFLAANAGYNLTDDPGVLDLTHAILLRRLGGAEPPALPGPEQTEPGRRRATPRP